jgi:hypothetical protein
MLKETFEKKLESIESQLHESVTSDKKDDSIEENEQNLDLFQKAKTYIYLKITINPPFNPIIPKSGLPTPNEILKKEEKITKRSTPDEICADFKKQLKIAIEAVAKEYVKYLGDNIKNQLTKNNKGNLGATKDNKEKTITQFLYHFNNSGKAELLKEKLKRFVIRIVREKYKEKDDIKGIFKDKRDQFYSTLFADLSDEVKIAMEEYVQLKRDELHEDIISSREQSKKETSHYSSRVLQEVKYNFKNFLERRPKTRKTFKRIRNNRQF